MTKTLKRNKGDSLFKNTAMLYALTASNYIFSFATIPYLTRVLGADVYGQVGFATAFSVYLQLVLDFGFMLSATADVAGCNRDSKQISEIFTAVSVSKLFLFAICTLTTVLIIAFVPRFSSDPVLFLGYLMYVFVNSLVPDYIYRGLENMAVITVRAVLIKAFFLVGVFLFVREPGDYQLVPYFYLIGSFGALIIVLMHVRRHYNIWFCRVTLSFTYETLKKSVQYFVSRIASTFYGAFNMMVLGFVSSGFIVGYYTACNNLTQAGKSISSPIADSLYPYMIRTRNHKLLFRMLLVGEAVIVPCCVASAIYAPDICGIIFGEDYRSASFLLCLMLPQIPIAFASYLLGFPSLVPLGKASIANTSVVCAAVTQIISIGLLMLLFEVNAFTLCIATLVSGLVETTIRLAATLRGLKHKTMD